MKQLTSLHIGVFDPLLICSASPRCGDEMFAFGFERNGYSVTRFDYRAVSDPNRELIKVAKRFVSQPNFVFIGKAERISPETLQELKSILPDSIFIKWFADMRHSPSENDLEHNKIVDWCFGTSGGEYLKQFLQPNMQGVCSLFVFTDSSYYYPYEVSKEFQSDVLWTGRKSTGDNLLRDQVINSLSKTIEKQFDLDVKDRFLIKMFGHDGKEWIQNDYVNYINGAKIGISVNSFSRRLYSSDRIANYMSCGTFMLSERIEGFDELLKDGKHLAYFSDIEEMNEKIKFYLKNESLRNKISAEGRELILKHYDQRPLVKHILDVIKTKKNERIWEDMFLN